MREPHDGVEDRERSLGLKRFHLEGGASGVEEACNHYQAASLVAAGSGAGGVGLLSAMSNLTTAFLYLQVPSIIRKLGSRKRTVVALSFLNVLSWLPIIVLVTWFRPVSLPLLIGLWVINLVPSTLLFATRNSWVADLTVAGSRGKYLGVRSSLLNGGYLATFYAMGFLLQAFSGERVFSGFAFVFLVGFLAALLSFLTYRRIVEPSRRVPEKATEGFFAFLSQATRRNLGRFMLYAVLLNFAIYLAYPYFAVYMLKELHFSYITFAIVSSSELVARIGAAAFWGRHADKVGSLGVLRIVSIFLPVIPILWLVSPNVVYLVGVQVLLGVMWAGYDLSVVNFIYGAIPAAQRLRYVVYHQTLNRAAMALGALSGVLLVSNIAPVLGSRILALFLLSGLLRFAVVLTMLPKLREAAKNGQVLVSVAEQVPAVAWTAARNSGLFHMPLHRAQFSRPAGRTQPVTAGKPLAVARPGSFHQWGPVPRSQPATTSDSLPGRGIFYRPRDWHWFSRPSAATKAPQITLGRGLFYRPKDWSLFGQALAAATVAGRPATLAPAGLGIFYRPRDWSPFASR